MIISKIVGGLGNQMFQYAIGKRIALDNNQPLYIDIDDFKTYRRPYFLDRFQIQAEVLDEPTAKAYRAFEKKYSLKLWLQALKPIARRNYRLETTGNYFHLINDYLTLPPKGNLYLNGYWQHPGYFEPIRATILKEFTLLPEHQIQDPKILEILKNNETIAIHFRRGEDQVNKALYGVPPMQYYEDAIRHIVSERPGKNVHLLIFSNEIEWVKENFKPDFPTSYVSSEFKLTDFQEFELMRLCNHQIVANSTFSWWAAWLNDYPERIIAAPKRWLGTDEYDTTGLIPKEWVRI